MTSFKRKHLCIPGLLARVRSQYKKLPDMATATNSHKLIDCLMSGIALFGLKYPSLLQFDKDGRQGQSPIITHNLKHLYGIEVTPSDTSFRERLDPVAPEPLQRGINRLVAQLQRGKVLECYRYLEDYTLLAIDGTEYFSSHEVRCENCCVKEHRDGSKTYYHQLLAAVVVNPGYSQVFPIMLEPIRKTDGARKNDCEHSALKRLLVNLRKAHPHLKLMVTLDGLYADGVIIQLLQALDIRFIITANEKDLKYLYEFYHAAKKQTLTLTRDKRDTTLSFVNQIPLNAKHPDLNVNMLTVEETIYQRKKNREHHLKFAWLMDIEITLKNAPTLMTGGRARWRVESAPQAHSIKMKDHPNVCKAVGKMMVGPSKSAVRSRFQTTLSGCH